MGSTFSFCTEPYKLCSWSCLLSLKGVWIDSEESCQAQPQLGDQGRHQQRKSGWQPAPGYCVRGMALYLCSPPPRSPGPQSHMREASDIPILRDILQNTWPIFLKHAMVTKKGEILETITIKRSQRSHGNEDVSSGRASGGWGWGCGNFLLSTQFGCEPKIALKNKVY